MEILLGIKKSTQVSQRKWQAPAMYVDYKYCITPIQLIGHDPAIVLLELGG